VLHDPKYRKKYELNLKREFPRIPFYADFRKWAKWGRALMDLHIGYETVKPHTGLKLTTAKTLSPGPSHKWEGRRILGRRRSSKPIKRPA
jgi:predicted helicase